ncbi:MAG TPA: dynamin family protein [Microbacterium sp.]|uniref:dynamin family protein n=1 Tax=Microbacterium sp. TaxID=51671 RepID=UPI002BAC968B|nr:dynamin family protein [Microbacterium sp.]HWI31680.1 dynamin family protein [Microbacterium sp.]
MNPTARPTAIATTPPSPQPRGSDSGPGAFDLVTLVEKARGLSRSLGRADLVKRLEQTRSRLVDPHVRVIIVGQFKQGKSKLVNALINAPACPVDDDVATSVPTSVGYAQEASAVVLVRHENGPDASIERIPIPLESLAEYVSERGSRDDERDIVGAEVLLPRELLKGGLRLIDSPGVGGLESTRSLSTLAALSTAHAVLLVSDASQEYTEPEVQFLRHAMRISPNVAAVLSKTDIYPEWRQIEQIDRTHLGDVGEVPIFAVSSDLRMLAAGQQDRDLNEESGFPALIAHLKRDVVGQAETINRRAAVHDLGSVVDQLSMSLQTELNALLHPEDTPRLIAQLEEAKSRADEFRSRSSRWQVTLSDGIADLISDTEHDLRDRLRKVQREAESSIEEGDPGPIWDQIAEWLDERVSAAVAETFVWTNERSQWLAEQVAVEFSEGESAIPLIDVADTEGLLDPVEQLQSLDEGRLGAAEKIYIGVRGSYGGVLMVGLATSLIGLSLVNPLSLLAGVIVGRRAYREDMSSRLTRRQLEAKNLVRRHIEDVVFQVGKQLKDRLRFVQRVARDHFGTLADQLHRSLSDAVLATKQAAATYTADRDGRVRELQLQLRRIEALRDEIPELLALDAKASR